MSVITKNYKVEFIVSNTVFTDITDFVVSLDTFVLQSTGKIATAKLTLNAEFGNFITDDNGGATPLLKQFDLIRVRVIGDDGVTEQLKIFEVTTDLAQLANRSSHFLPIELEGRERNLSGIPFGGFFRNATHREIVDEIRRAFNIQKGTAQPGFFVQTPNVIPDFNPNIWDFTQVDNCYDALLVILDSLNLPVSAGGGGNRFAMVFEDVYFSFPNDIDLGVLDLKIIIQGSNNSPGPFPVLQQNDEHPITKIDKIKSPASGTLVVARGRPKTAQQPQNYSLFLSRLEFYRAVKEYDNAKTYAVDSFVRFGKQTISGGSQRWKAITENIGVTPTVGPNWQLQFVRSFIGLLQYSPFTEDKARPIQNGFGNPKGGFDATLTDAIAVPDHNLVINDVRVDDNNTIGTFRDFVVFRAFSPKLADLTTTQKEYLFDLGGGNFGFYNGFKVLVDPNLGTLEPPFDGLDVNGLPFENNIAIYTNPSIVVTAGGVLESSSAWTVVREHQDFDQCAIYSEAANYEFNVSFDLTQVGYRYPGEDRQRGGIGPTFEWRDISNIFMGNDCWHNPVSIANVQGLIVSDLPDGEPLKDPNGDFYNLGTSGGGSAVEVTFGYNKINQTQKQRNVWFEIAKRVITQSDLITSFIVGLFVDVFQTFVTPQYTNMGWWFAWPSPFPYNTSGGIQENIGFLYGGNFATLNRHRYFDLFNIQFTTIGNTGWTHPESSDLSEITGVEFLFNFDITAEGNRIEFSGDLPFLYWCIDKFGTTWKSQKIMYRHLGETQQIRIEFGDLSPVARNRTPFGVSNILEQIIVAEVEVNEVFFKDNIIIQGFQWESSYDEFGRYNPELIEQILKPSFFDFFQGGGGAVRFIGVIDAYGFTKTPVAISAPNSFSDERRIIPQFEEYQNIVNVEQLQRFADSAQQIEEFQFEQYTIEQGGINDLELEDTVALKDVFLINNNDQGNNTRIITVRELHYSVPADGGLIRKIVGVKVIDT